MKGFRYIIWPDILFTYIIWIRGLWVHIKKKKNLGFPAVFYRLNVSSIVDLYAIITVTFFTLSFHISGQRNPSWRAQRTWWRRTANARLIFQGCSVIKARYWCSGRRPQTIHLHRWYSALYTNCRSAVVQVLPELWSNRSISQFTEGQTSNKQHENFRKTARNNLKGDHQHKSKG